MDLKSIRTLVFAGGGVRGLAFVGALQTLRDECGIDFGAKTPKLETVSGVSVGTLFALMIVLGYTVADITGIASAMRNSDVMDTDPVRLLSGEISLDDGEKLRSRVESLISKKGFSTTITFTELFNATGISFHLVVTDLTTASVVHINEKSHPNLSVVTGMVASMSLPLIYPPVVSPEGHLWIDGGVMENFPMTRFDPKHLLGFDFKMSIQCKVDTLLNYISRVLYVQQVSLDVIAWSLMSKAHQNRCVMIDTGDVSTIKNISDLTNEMREALLKAGKQAILKKMEEWKQEENFSLDFSRLDEQSGLPSFLSALKTCSPPASAYK
jgi:predicted acylesterase/phospholipase RssA